MKLNQNGPTKSMLQIRQENIERNLKFIELLNKKEEEENKKEDNEEQNEEQTNNNEKKSSSPASDISNEFIKFNKNNIKKKLLKDFLYRDNEINQILQFFSFFHTNLIPTYSFSPFSSTPSSSSSTSTSINSPFLLLLGPSSSGKTSLIKSLVSSYSSLSIFLDCDLIDNMKEFFNIIYSRLLYLISSIELSLKQKLGKKILPKSYYSISSINILTLAKIISIFLSSSLLTSHYHTNNLIIILKNVKFLTENNFKLLLLLEKLSSKKIIFIFLSLSWPSFIKNNTKLFLVHFKQYSYKQTFNLVLFKLTSSSSLYNDENPALINDYGSSDESDEYSDEENEHDTKLKVEENFEKKISEKSDENLNQESHNAEEETDVDSDLEENLKKNLNSVGSEEPPFKKTKSDDSYSKLFSSTLSSSSISSHNISKTTSVSSYSSINSSASLLKKVLNKILSESLLTILTYTLNINQIIIYIKNLWSLSFNFSIENYNIKYKQYNKDETEENFQQFSNLLFSSLTTNMIKDNLNKVLYENSDLVNKNQLSGASLKIKIEEKGNFLLFLNIFTIIIHSSYFL